MTWWAASWAMGMLRASVVGAFALGLAIGARRNGPDVGARAGLAGLIAMSATFALSFAPWPRWSDNENKSERERIAETSRPDQRMATNANPRTFVRASDAELDAIAANPIRSRSASPRREMNTESPTIARWSEWLEAAALAHLIGAAVLTGRFLLSRRAARRFAKAARPIRDPDLIGLADELRERSGLRRGVVLRSAPELRGPATFGWRRPVILLPDGWRLWDRDHLRAALAHELAHIQRGDYLRRAVADLLAGWFWLNPLARALAARLRLDQELATDLAALSRAGGRRTYLKALARLALRLDGLTELTEARSFPALGGGTLLRRIEMLRNGGCIERTPVGSSWSLKTFLAGVLVGAAALTLAFRPDWSEPAALAARDVKAAALEKEKPAPLETAPFDLTHVPDDASVVVAIRPKVLMKASVPLQTAMAAMNAEIAVLVAQAAGFGFDIDEIDQAIAVMPRVSTPLLLGGGLEAALFAGAVILRSEKAIDLKGLRGLGFVIQDATYAGQTYQRANLDGLAIGAFRPDDRTVIIATESVLFPFIDRAVNPSRRAGDHPLSQAWSAVASKPIAIAVDVGSLRGLASVVTEGKGFALFMPLAPISPLWEEVRTHLIGLEIGDKLEVETVAACVTEAGADSVQATCQALLTLARNSRKPLVEGYSSLLGHDQDGAGPLVQLMMQRVVKPIEEMLNEAKVTREGTVVRYRASIKLDLAAFLPFVL